MFLAIHVPMFGTANIESKRIECPTCPKGASFGVSDWEEVDVTRCDPNTPLTCKQCGTKVTINWGLVEPDHLSTWLNSEHCPHRLCREKYQQLKAELIAAENSPAPYGASEGKTKPQDSGAASPELLPTQLPKEK